mgnify:CR=1 FL=1
MLMNCRLCVDASLFSSGPVHLQSDATPLAAAVLAYGGTAAANGSAQGVSI